MSKNKVIVDKNKRYKALCCIFLAGVMILFSLFLVSGTITTTLNSPADGLNNSMNRIIFNCSTVTGNPYFLTNISLWTNSTGTWSRNLTSNLINYTPQYTNTSVANEFKVMSKNITNINKRVFNYTNKVWGDSGVAANIYLRYGYANGTIKNTSIQSETSTTPVEHFFTSPFVNDYVSFVEVWMYSTSGYTAYEGFDNLTLVTNTTSNIFSQNITGYAVWNCESCNNQSECDFDTNRTINYNLYENSRTVPVSSSQGSTQSFILNLTATDSVTSAYLNYNGTRYSASISAGTYTIISTSMVIPSITADGSATIFWELFTTYGGVNSTTSTMAVSTSTIDNCTNNHIPIYNFTIKDEESKTVLGVITGKVNAQVYSFDRSTLITNYSTTSSSNYFALCINSTFGATEKFSIDTVVEYKATDYSTEYYNMQNETLNNNYLYQNISLYDLNSTAAKVFKIVYKDAGYKAVEDAIIKIYRKYTGDLDLWKISEIPITDYKGETTASLVENNVIYSFYVYKYGTLLSSFENVFVKCQYSSIDQCTLNLDDISSGISIIDVEEELDFNFTLGYNKTTRTVASVFNIPSGTSHLVSLVVTTNDALETSVCTDSITSSSGTVSCVVPNTFGNSTITAKLYKDGVFQSYGNIKLDQDPSDIYGGALVMLGLLMLFSLIGASLTGNPVVMIISFLIGIIALVALNLVASNGFLGAGSSVLFLVVAIIIILIKIGRRN
jgi:hypothetical protein